MTHQDMYDKGRWTAPRGLSAELVMDKGLKIKGWKSGNMKEILKCFVKEIATDLQSKSSLHRRARRNDKGGIGVIPCKSQMFSSKNREGEYYPRLCHPGPDRFIEMSF